MTIGRHRQVGLQQQRLLTVAEVSRRLSMPQSTVYEMARQRRIGGVVRLGRLIRFDPRGLEEWIEQGGQALAGGWRQDPEQ